MSIVYTALVIVIMLGVLVVVHEWGHFIAARLCGIRVDEFSIGFGGRAARIGKLGDTEYNIRWIPLGGFVKIAGMEPDEEPLLRAGEKLKAAGSKDEGPEAKLGVTDVPLLAENTPNLTETAEQRKRDETEGFYAHSLWQRAFVIFAGPFMSFVLGYVIIFGLILFTGNQTVTNQVKAVTPGTEAQRIGLMPGDKITSLNGVNITVGEQMINVIHNAAGKPLKIEILRGGKDIWTVGTPRATSIDGESIGTLGFTPEISKTRVALPAALKDSNSVIASWYQQVGSLVTHHNIKELRQSAGGPIFIAQMTHKAVSMGPDVVFSLTADLSLSLAIFNLLPIPILDGGHLLLFAIEGLRRGRRLTPEQQQNFMLAGLAIIGVLFVLIMFNDIMRSIHPIGP